MTPEQVFDLYHRAIYVAQLGTLGGPERLCEGISGESGGT
jgi:hypothetical protein